MNQKFNSKNHSEPKIDEVLWGKYLKLLDQSSQVEEYGSLRSSRLPLRSSEFSTCFALILESNILKNNMYKKEGALIHVHDYNLTQIQRIDVVNLINDYLIQSGSKTKRDLFVGFANNNQSTLRAQFILGKIGFTNSANILEDKFLKHLGVQITPRLYVPHKEWDMLYDIIESSVYVVSGKEMAKYDLFK